MAVETYRVVGEFRDYGLKDQMQRAAVSIASNIAEGSERGGLDFVRFLRIASGSCAELRTQLYIAKKLELLESHDFNELVGSTKQISKMIWGLQKSLKNTEN
ncbi:MAG: four helix bundle protein [Pirellulaceae bacterium]